MPMEGEGADYVQVSARGVVNAFREDVKVEKRRRGRKTGQLNRATPIIANPIFDPTEVPGAIGDFLETDGALTMNRMVSTCVSACKQLCLNQQMLLAVGTATLQQSVYCVCVTIDLCVEDGVQVKTQVVQCEL